MAIAKLLDGIVAFFGPFVACYYAFYGRWDIACFFLIAATNCEIGLKLPLKKDAR